MKERNIEDGEEFDQIPLTDWFIFEDCFGYIIGLFDSQELNEDCKRAYTSTNEYGPDDDRVFCYGLVDYSTDELIEKCKNCKALVWNATPPQEKRK